MLDSGDPFPRFQLPDQSGQLRDFESLTAANGLVIYAYPKDDTPGCTVEAKDFRDLQGEFHRLGYDIVGVSKDDGTSHCRFIAKYNLPFSLLSDSEGELLTAIGAWGEKKLYGRVSLGIIRSTFIIGRDGKLAKAFRNVRTKGHAQRVLDTIEAFPR